MSLLISQSCWVELAVIAFWLEWVFPSKAIEMLCEGFDLLPPSLCSGDQWRLGLLPRL